MSITDENSKSATTLHSPSCVIPRYDARHIIRDTMISTTIVGIIEYNTTIPAYKYHEIQPSSSRSSHNPRTHLQLHTATKYHHQSINPSINQPVKLIPKTKQELEMDTSLINLIPNLTSALRSKSSNSKPPSTQAQSAKTPPESSKSSYKSTSSSSSTSTQKSK